MMIVPFLQMLASHFSQPSHQPFQRAAKNRKKSWGAPVCPSCRVTLSHKQCLNRMCREFLKAA